VRRKGEGRGRERRGEENWFTELWSLGSPQSAICRPRKSQYCPFSPSLGGLRTRSADDQGQEKMAAPAQAEKASPPFSTFWFCSGPRWNGWMVPVCCLRIQMLIFPRLALCPHGHT
jgi:hypothetical protein